ncbi:transporter [Halobacterium noricense]|uniref:transporter n=1 Tax=Halobacterium noricense TaxID=223182 RepID=UPI001E587C35|nr:transporter [Halobacterium noricense]UHH24601.1 transporter [Halobacterium noricense]
MSERVPSNSRSTDLGIGAAAGAVAYVLGYLLTYLWQGSSVQERLEGYNAVVELLGGDPIPTWKAVGWLFYNAHGVSFTVPSLGSGQATRNLIADGSAPMLLYLVPAVVVALAGFVLARRANATDASGGAQIGARVVLGYVVLAVVGLFVFEYAAGGSAIHPEYALGVLLAGVVHPAVFGGIGGALGAVTST